MKTTFALITCLALSIITWSQSSVWQNIGPYGLPNTISGSFITGNGNGRICTIALQPGSDLIWAGSPRGALWSKDFSTISNPWTPVYLSYLWVRSSVSAIAVDQFDSENILIGTGENESPFEEFSKRFSSIGIFKSSDGGTVLTSTDLSYINTGDTEFSEKPGTSVANPG